MRQPKLKDIKIDIKGTEKIRNRIAKAKKVKITINIDEDILSALKLRSEESGIPYQNLVNRLLRSAVSENAPSASSARLDRLEKEVANLKRKMSA